MDPMLFLMSYGTMQRQLDENARLRLQRGRAEARERRPGLWRTLREAVTAAVARTGRRTGRQTAVAALDVPFCCPA